MGLKMKNISIMGVDQSLGEGGGTKNNTYRELPKNGCLDNLQGLGKI